MFKFKGKSSDAMGVLLQDELIFPKPETNYENTEIEGMDGSYIKVLNRKNVEKTVHAVLKNREKQDEVKAWLDGEGEFEYNGRYRKAYVLSGIEFEKHGPFKYEFDITFIFEPYWRKHDDFMLVEENVRNAGNVESRPVIKMTGTGTVDLTINGCRFAVTFDEDEEIEINCEEMTESKPKCISIGFEYPILMPGENEIIIHSGSAKIYMKGKDRWI